MKDAQLTLRRACSPGHPVTILFANPRLTAEAPHPSEGRATAEALARFVPGALAQLCPFSFAFSPALAPRSWKANSARRRLKVTLHSYSKAAKIPLYSEK